MFSFMPSFIPNIIQIAPFVLAFALLCTKPLRKFAGCFYIAWAFMVAAVTWFDPVIDFCGDSAPVLALMADSIVSSLGTTNPALDMVVQLFTSSYTGVCMYLIVMFVGALDRTSLVKRLLSIRTELSVIGGIIIFGHVIRVATMPFMFANPAWMEMWGSPAGEFMFAAVVVVGPLLTLVFLIPWITSFRAIRRRMKPSTWKKTQKLAYPFMALLVLQGFFLAVGHCLYGYPYTDNMTLMAMISSPTEWLASFAQQVATACVYLFFGVSYVALRLRKHQRDKAKREQAKLGVQAKSQVDIQERNALIVDEAASMKQQQSQSDSKRKISASKII